MERSALFIACLFAACSSHGARERAEGNASEAGVYYQGEGPFAPVREEDVGAAIGDALQRQFERCCEQLGRSFETTPEGAASYAQHFAQADANSGARFQPAAAAACVASIETGRCPRSKDAPPLAGGPCQALYLRGTRRPGDPCISPWDCAAGGPDTVAVCTGDRGAATCALQRVLREGERCTAAELPLCASNTFCDPARNVCVSRAALGQACLTGPNFGDTCAAGAVCDRQGTKRCVRARSTGERCAEPEECEDLACVDGVCREPLSVRPICDGERPSPLPP